MAGGGRTRADHEDWHIVACILELIFDLRNELARFFHAKGWRGAGDEAGILHLNFLAGCLGWDTVTFHGNIISHAWAVIDILAGGK
jgi:hypothetical protein